MRLSLLLQVRVELLERIAYDDVIGDGCGVWAFGITCGVNPWGAMVVVVEILLLHHNQEYLTSR